MALTSFSSTDLPMSSSSYCSSSHYSSSNTYRSEGSGGGAAEPLFEPSLDAAVVGPSKPVWRGGGCGPPVWPPFSGHHKDSYGYPVPGTLVPQQCLGFTENDATNKKLPVSGSPVLENGSVSDTFTHKTMLLEDMDPLSVRGTLTPEGRLVARVRKNSTMEALKLPNRMI
ncbi:heat shock protein beta-7-like [Oncorhynchus masou masou]|uniref:heat shock protein beta-7-like n=1 Tax=Oncorhynchus masou masou TaxID=90313 RepID=UPI003182C6A4